MRLGDVARPFAALADRVLVVQALGATPDVPHSARHALMIDRALADRATEPTAALIDSQTAKAPALGAERGFDGAKKSYAGFWVTAA